MPLGDSVYNYFMENIEVEIRSFVTQEKFDELVKYFDKNAKFIKTDDQETYYLDSKEDLRIQRNNSKTKIWLKKGKMHDQFREEIEINFSKEDFEKVEQLFQILGYKTKIKWFRTRREYDWNGIKVDLDYTRGYGYILELEKMTDEKNKKSVYKELEKKISLLRIEKSSQEEFEMKFINYENNWENLTSIDSVV